MKILVCDDSAVLRRSVSNMIQSIDNHQIIEAINGSEAVDLYSKHLPDLVIMDILMPVMTGLEATKLIMEKYPKANIVILSSVGTQTNLKTALKYGARDFIQKPIEMPQLISILDKVREV